MRELAIVKIGLRTQFLFTTGNNAPEPEARHWISHPVTRHNVGHWRERGRGEFRLPNSLRFKVRPDPDDPGKLVGVIFHVPCLPPRAFQPNRIAIEHTWQAVHHLLDELTIPAKGRGYTSIIDEKRRAQLRTQLDLVTLARSPQ
jgi:CRISPR-associated protein Cmr1